MREFKNGSKLWYLPEELNKCQIELLLDNKSVCVTSNHKTNEIYCILNVVFFKLSFLSMLLMLMFAKCEVERG